MRSTVEWQAIAAYRRLFSRDDFTRAERVVLRRLWLAAFIAGFQQGLFGVSELPGHRELIKLGFSGGTD